MTPATLTKRMDPLVEQLLEAVKRDETAPRSNGARTGKKRSGNGNGNGRKADAKSRAQARRVATRVGRGMLLATNTETATHSDDVVVISRAICDLLEIRGEQRQDLLAAAHLHDIGKAAIPATIINKPGPLTAEEWELMRAHTEVGADILASVPELEGIARVVRHSHERWDGQGYPDGLAGEDIPLGSRIIFCADAFHAIRSDRPYRPGRPAPEVLVEVMANSGTQFDPKVVAAFEEVVRDLRIVTGPRRVRRSSRLTALLLVLGVGVTGSAIGRSDLLGQANLSTEESPAASLPISGSLLSGYDFRGAPSSKRGVFGLSAGLTSTADQDGSGPKDGLRRTRKGARDGSGGIVLQDVAPGPSGGGATGGGATGGGDQSKGGQRNGNGPPGSTPGNSGNNPHGGPPGLSGGGPPGQLKQGEQQSASAGQAKK